MTAKEKANSIVFNMLKYSSELSNDLYTGNASIYKFRNAKQCALIAVDEVMKICPYLSKDNCDTVLQLRSDDNQFVSYWEQVKTEIENI